MIQKDIYMFPFGAYNESLSVIVEEHMIEEFKEVIKRGTLFGTQTSPEMKRFADTLLGRISYTHQGSQLQSTSYGGLTVQVVEN